MAASHSTRDQVREVPADDRPRRARRACTPCLTTARLTRHRRNRNRWSLPPIRRTFHPDQQFVAEPTAHGSTNQDARTPWPPPAQRFLERGPGCTSVNRSQKFIFAHICSSLGSTVEQWAGPAVGTLDPNRNSRWGRMPGRRGVRVGLRRRAGELTFNLRVRWSDRSDVREERGPDDPKPAKTATRQDALGSVRGRC
jgi:hypothetical protein